MEKVQLIVAGMNCGHCVNAIEGALKEINVQGQVDLESKTVSVEYDASQHTLDQIKEAIEEQGYEVQSA